MKTFIPKIDPNRRQWWLVDLDGAIMGRAAVQIANVLRGKNKPIFTPHLDTGDHVVVVNAEKVAVTGNKMQNLFRYHYTGYPGGLKKASLGEQLQKNPARAFELTVRRMLPKNRLGRKMIKKLHVYAGPDHPHTAQKPQKLELVSKRK
ncbi:MAG: 50S ribosomal protein L13 [Candidatus Zixiibacteriota bacterium]|nr:MAG: 50S ribosomal protein L13 [candidate division Zixibacteria bacterium]